VKMQTWRDRRILEFNVCPRIPGEWRPCHLVFGAFPTPRLAVVSGRAFTVCRNLGAKASEQKISLSILSFAGPMARPSGSIYSTHIVQAEHNQDPSTGLGGLFQNHLQWGVILGEKRWGWGKAVTREEHKV
jgi:hypothetical protein